MHQPCYCDAAEFSRNSVRLVKRCSKPDGKEFQKVTPDVLLAFKIKACVPPALITSLSAVTVANLLCEGNSAFQAMLIYAEAVWNVSCTAQQLPLKSLTTTAWADRRLQSGRPLVSSLWGSLASL